MTLTPHLPRILHPALLVVLLALPLAAQSPSARPPVIDVHLHAMPPAGVGRDSVDVRYRLLTVLPANLSKVESVERRWVGIALGFPCDRGKSVMFGAPCLPNGATLPDTAWLRAQLEGGQIQALGELVPQYVGMSPADPRLEPYWALAEAFDIPVGIHMGSGPPAAAYESSPTPVKMPEYRAAYSDPVLLEEVLLRHKKLRLVVLHAGWPMLDQMIAMLYAHPGVYVDVGVLQNEALIPRPAYYGHLRGLVEAGFAKRIMFGSDFPAGAVGAGIDAILAADFLTAEQKSDILCGNAMRFLRLPESTCQPEP